MRLLNQSSADNRAVLKHIFKIYKVAVMHMLSKIISVMEMNYSLLMRFYNIRREQNTLCYILTDFARHIVALNAVYGRVFV